MVISVKIKIFDMTKANKIKSAALDGVEQLLLLVGEDPTREGLKETPRRVVDAFTQRLSGYQDNIKEILSKTFENKYNAREIILLRDIEVKSTCEHHLLPFIGKAHVAYIPGERIVGLSKLARLVKALSRRLQLQERLTSEICNLLYSELGAKGAGVIIEAKHFCMISRGVEESASTMVTTCFRGEMKQRREELMSLIKL